MAILNYTTTIDAYKSISEIQYQLVKHGATAILTEYTNEQKILGISFKINTQNGTIGIKLPANVDPVLKILENEKKKRNSSVKATYEQAERVAWRILKDWVEAQMAILETQMVQIEEIFLPYILNKSGQTVFERYQNNILMLEE